MQTAERVLMWCIVLFLLYQNSNKVTEETISAIAADEIRDYECVTEDFLESNYVTIENTNNALKNVANNIVNNEESLLIIKKDLSKVEAGMLDIDGRVLGLELKN